jgi:ubiquinone/menaquinone biosynthesis C-methylase UbiE
MIDAQKTQLPDEKFDFVILSNMIHHVAQPATLFKEVLRILKPGGTLLIQEIHSSFFCKLILLIMRHEGWDECVDVFDPDEICNDPTDLWSANCSVPRMLFDDQKKFVEVFSEWEFVHDDHSEFLVYLNSGGGRSEDGLCPPTFVFT